jgi:hypothetical protein
MENDWLRCIGEASYIDNSCIFCYNISIMTTPETPRQEPVEPMSELTAAARDTFTDPLAFMDARRQAAIRAAERNLGGVSLSEQFAEYDAQRVDEPLPPPPNDSHQ